MTHEGTVIAVNPGSVKVQILSVSACASCAAHSKCGFAESKEKTLDIPVDNPSAFTVDEKVEVRISEERGLLATWIAYILPALLIVAAAVALSLVGLPEPTVILLTFAALALYLLLLYLLRHKINNNFTLSVSPLTR